MGHAHHQHRPGCTHGPATADSAKTIDPVCGMTVNPETTANKASHEGQPFFFC
ncbi:MAG: hypothetical protein B7Y78_07940, partial [Caulobacter sp. 35-67-4]